MTDIATKEPTKIRAGDSVKWIKSLTDYPASTWTLTYSLVNSEQSITITTVADVDDHSVVVLPAVTALYMSGRYTYIGRVTDGVDSYTVSEGFVYIESDLSSGITDLKTQNEKVLDALDALLINKASKDQQMMSIEGRQLQRYSFPDLIAAQKHYKQLVAQERRAANFSKSGTNTNLIRARF